MKGRLEHSLQAEKNITVLLSELPEFVEDYYYEFKAGRQPKACLEYIRKIKKFLCFINPNPKDIDLKDLTQKNVAKFMNNIIYIVDANGNRKESSLAYQKSYHSILKSFFNYLLDNDMINKNPMVKIKRPRGNDYVNRQYLTEDNLRQIINTVDIGAGTERMISCQDNWRNRDKAIIMTFIQTGIRETALTEINVSDIDFHNHTISSVIEKGHKNKTFSMSKELEDVIYDWINDRKKLNIKDNDALFISKNKRRISAKSTADIVKKYTEEALGHAVSPHKLRAAFANLMLTKTNGNIYIVQQLLGHSRTDTTKIYLNNNINEYNDLAADIVSKTLFN